MSRLDFTRVQRINVERCEAETGFNHSLRHWSLMEWGGACIAEFGEAENIAKKMRRLELNIRGNKREDQDYEALRHKLAGEIADGVIYAFLWAAAANIDLGQAVINAFNAKSDEIGSPLKL